MIIQNDITKLFGVRYPIVQAGMVWVSGWKLASAVSEAGCLGLIGAGSMKPELLSEHIDKCKQATEKPFGVNIPLLREDAGDLIDTVIEKGIKIVFTSAGNPGKFIDKLKRNNITVVHVVPSLKYAQKAESVGCDAVVGEGIEAGGHNGKDEITTFCLIPQLKDFLRIPVIAAGGISDGRSIAAAFALGADGVQIGTRFAATEESSAHINYKMKLLESGNEDSILILRKIAPVRVIKNRFAMELKELEDSGADKNGLLDKLGHKKERLGIFEGDIENGLIEAGQSLNSIKEILPACGVIENLLNETMNAIKNLKELCHE
ncbi:NAD(P)H-dependent flavin oxidoreductase [Melioribacter sp. Ez-97]|uniref:NAD(P)H-dependent flavin oxidoreductase n=1 Tax=Melioribacter sp. Ez-97 TaxID=3423434 RepID=UPI003ED9CA09